ncbi:amidohydrolase family protein [Phenylobacterium sp. LjRoot225]|uniref:amidohydrolase family protein n=1 Tax=Phenylobacterium sp. LjRoot225 TaxID=3342285 RepID=UPI003ECC4082
MSRSAWDDHIDEAWLAQVQEPALDPELPIVDPHHHVWAKPFPYETPELLADLTSGHRVVGTVYTEAHRGYRTNGPEHLRPVGETEFIAALGEASDRAGNAPRICAGITGAGDLTMGAAKVDELLDAHIAAGKGRFSGLRANIFVTFDPATLAMKPLPGSNSAVDDADFVAGVARLARRGLALDLVSAHAHLEHVARLAGRIPEAVIVLDHLAPIADFGERPTPQSELLAAWRRGLAAIAPHDNVHMKLGGLANPFMSGALPAFRSLREQATPPTSEQLAELYRPMVSQAIETLGAARCMFESNFPVDKRSTSYRVLWNAFKRLARAYSEEERRALLMGTAARVYRLRDLPL